MFWSTVSGPPISGIYGTRQALTVRAFPEESRSYLVSPGGKPRLLLDEHRLLPGISEGKRINRTSSRLLQFHDRERCVAFVKRNVQLQPNATAALRSHSRCRTQRVLWPACTRFKSTLFTGRGLSAVDFLWSSSTQALMRTVFIEPRNETADMLAKVLTPQQDGDAAKELLFQRSYESLYDANAAVLPHSSIAPFDAFAVTPCRVPLTDKLLPLIADNILRCGSGPPDDSPEKGPDLRRGRICLEDSNPHNTPREVVHDDRDPPAHRPCLVQCSGHPWHPEATRRWHRRKIHQPRMIRTPRHNARNRALPSPTT